MADNYWAAGTQGDVLHSRYNHTPDIYANPDNSFIDFSKGAAVPTGSGPKGKANNQSSPFIIQLAAATRAQWKRKKESQHQLTYVTVPDIDVFQVRPDFGWQLRHKHITIIGQTDIVSTKKATIFSRHNKNVRHRTRTI